MPSASPPAKARLATNPSAAATTPTGTVWSPSRARTTGNAPSASVTSKVTVNDTAAATTVGSTVTESATSPGADPGSTVSWMHRPSARLQVKSGGQSAASVHATTTSGSTARPGTHPPVTVANPARVHPSVFIRAS